MAHISLLDRLAQIAARVPSGGTMPIPGQFHSWPANGSVRAGMHAMLPPRIGEWKRAQQQKFENTAWTHRCQGVTSDGTHWFISSNNADFRGIYKFTATFDLLGRATFPAALGDHIGDIDYHDGAIYAAIERKGFPDPTPRVARFTTTPAFLDVAVLHTSAGEEVPQKKDLPWCAMHPWNTLLYSSNFNDVDRVHAYVYNGHTQQCTFVTSLALQGGVVHAVQGGCFSPNGHLYLTSHASEEIRAYSVLNGAFLGAFRIDMDESFPKKEELEGIAIWPMTVHGDAVHLHTLLLDRDAITTHSSQALDPDDIFLKHIAVPDPTVL